MFNVLVILSSFVLGKGNVSAVQNHEKVVDIDRDVYEEVEDRAEGILHKNNNLNDQPIRLYLKEEDRIITLGLEEYVIGVVSAEMPASFEIEALKAQAVAARTYAMAHLKCVTGKGCSLNKEADLCDTVHCQVYMNKEKRMEKWHENNEEELYDKIVQAVNSTKGEVLTYEGKLVMHPYYFSTSSGNTEDSVEVFGVDEPYLKSVPSVGEERAQKYKTEFSFTKEQVLSLIKNKYPMVSVKAANINEKTLLVKSRTEQGTVKSIALGNISMTGAEFRSILGLTSANFNLSYRGDNVNISCKGYGHGVGMSQWGAGAMAKEGVGYREILKHYYTGVTIE
ncbi:stage II sporulation protein D [Hathewaya proteolytica]|nr:stage II sporulation protein D [Hathewaya proteolytica]